MKHFCIFWIYNFWFYSKFFNCFCSCYYNSNCSSSCCCFELFNNCKTYPELLSDENKTDISIYKSKRVRISFDEGKDTEFRYFVPILSSDWEKPRIAVFEKKIGSEYFVLKDKKSIKYADSVTIDENGVVEGTLVYPR